VLPNNRKLKIFEYESDSAQRMSQFIVGMLAPTFGDHGDGKIGAALSWGSRAAPIFASRSFAYK